MGHSYRTNGPDRFYARLIAEAPAMLALVKKFAQYVKDNGGDKEYHDKDGGWLSQCQSLISRIEGETK